MENKNKVARQVFKSQITIQKSPLSIRFLRSAQYLVD